MVGQSLASVLLPIRRSISHTVGADAIRTRAAINQARDRRLGAAAGAVSSTLVAIPIGLYRVPIVHSRKVGAAGDAAGARCDCRRVIRNRAHVAALIIASLALPAHALPASAQGLVLSQSVQQTHAIDPAMVERLPAIDLQVSFATGHGVDQATYTGALL